MTGLRNFNLLHEWIDDKRKEGTEEARQALQDAGTICKIGKAGPGWLCGDGMFDSIPVLLSEADAQMSWESYTNNPSLTEEENEINSEDKLVENIRNNAVKVLQRKHVSKKDFENMDQFKNFIKNLLWSNKTIRTNFGYNDKDRWERSFEDGGLFSRYEDRYGVNVVESIWDSISI